MKLKRFAFANAALGICLFFLSVGFHADLGFSQTSDVVEQFRPNGKVNWSAGFVEATGIGTPPEQFYGKPLARPLAKRAAALDAHRNLLEIVKGVRVEATAEVRDYATANDTIRAKVEDMVNGAPVFKTDYMSNDTVEVTIRMSLNGDFAKTVFPVQTPDQATPQAGGAFTGMVVDARGIQARPAMAPKIVDESGQEVYSAMMVDREFAVQQGMTGYARDLSSAQANPRLANPGPPQYRNPITVKGIRTDGPGKVNIVIANIDAQKIRDAAAKSSFLKEAHVMIVLD